MDIVELLLQKHADITISDKVRCYYYQNENALQISTGISRWQCQNLYRDGSVLERQVIQRLQPSAYVSFIDDTLLQACLRD